MTRAAAVYLLLAFTTSLRADPPSPENGRRSLETQAFTHAAWKLSAYDLLWKTWGANLDRAPENYEAAVRDRYGLHPAPFKNGRLPMGLREGSSFFGKGLTTDCLLCHGGSILGKSYLGLGNASLDIQAFFEELNKSSGLPAQLPFTFGRVRGTSEAGAMAVYLHSFRDTDLKLRLKRHDFALRDDMVEDTPAWWLLKKKKTMYFTGTVDARSVRSIMQFMLSPLNPAEDFTRHEPTFRDIQAFILSLEAPRYPFAIEQEKAGRGAKIFAKTCAQCHGTYGPDGTYPNKIVPLDVVGTDANRFHGLPEKLGEHYNRSWFAREIKDGGYQVVEPRGYQAPPLDGIWATAPYFHNGSVPTLYHVLNSKARPKLFTRSYRTDEDAYDQHNVGWKFSPPAAGSISIPHEQRKIYDTTQPGRGNAGHNFGDDLSDDERRAVIEYLKTL